MDNNIKRNRRTRPKYGDVIRIPLGNKQQAFARVLVDGVNIAVYDIPLDETKPPIGLRVYKFVAAIDDDDFLDLKIVGKDPPRGDEEHDDYAPPKYIWTDLVPNWYRIYYKGKEYESTKEECEDLDSLTIWGIGYIKDKILTGEWPD